MFSSFMIDTWIAASIVAVVAGIVGFFVVVRGNAFAAHALPLGSFPGAAMAHVLGINDFVGVGLFAALGIAGISQLGRRSRHDVATALSLVTGATFEAATESRFKWLFKPGQQRWDEILVGAIHDAAHILATRAVTAGRTDLVRVACDAARKASPHSDIAWLDEAAATEAESGRDAAGELIRERRDIAGEREINQPGRILFG